MTDTSSKLKIKAGILAASSLQMAIIGVSAAIPLMMVSFPDAGATTIQSVVTLPSLISIPISLIVGTSSAKIGKKIPLLFGIAIICLSGLVPALFDVSLPMLLLACVGIGVGNGLLIPTSTGLITDHFEGLEQGDLMGKQSAFINLGAMILALIGGILAVSHWRSSFFIYLYTVPMFFIVLLCIPKDKKYIVSDSTTPASKTQLSKEVYLMTGMVFLYAIFFGVLNTNNGILVAEKNLGNAATAGLASSSMSGIGIVVGMLYGKISSKLKKLTLPVAIAAVSCGMLLMSSATSSTMLYLGAIICGIGFSITMPTGMFRAAQSVNLASSTVAVSVYLAACNLAMFLSPLLMVPLSAGIANGTAQSRYIIGAIGLIILCILSFLHTRKDE